MTTKEKILQIISQKKDTVVSGEQLAKECGVSRAAVWKAVNSLRQQGYSIQGTTNGGYIFSADNDIVDEHSFRSYLLQHFPQFSEIHIECFKQIDSTNTYAKKILSECGNLRDSEQNLTKAGKEYHKSVFVSESQTAGRGRLGRTFYSPDKTGIYFSVIYSPQNGITNPAKLTAFSAVAVCRAIKKLFSLNAQIKWINDVFLNGKKVCGILTEGFTNFETGMIESAVIGIGINITDNPLFSQTELSKTAGSVLGTLNDSNSSMSPSAPHIQNISRIQIAAEITGELFKILEEVSDNSDNTDNSEHCDNTSNNNTGNNYNTSNNGNNNTDNIGSTILNEYKKLSFLTGKRVTVHPVIDSTKSVYQAEVIDIDDNAGLIVKDDSGNIKVLNSGEVSLHSDLCSDSSIN